MKTQKHPWLPAIALGVIIFFGFGPILLDDGLAEVTKQKARCLVTGIEAAVNDAGELTEPRPMRARCTIAELGLSWNATAAQLGITAWTVAIGDTIDADVTRSVSRFIRREHFGAYVFTNVKRT